MPWFADLRNRFESFITPSPVGLPRLRTVLVPLAVLSVPFVLLVGFGITGSSTGYLYSLLFSDPDPRLLFWAPRAIRSDEWLVHSGWVISQVQQGLPLVNQSLFGGVSTSFLQEIPTFDWSVIFRPQLWGFFVLPFDQAVAFKWWLPMFLLIASSYFLFVSLVPRRPISGLVISIAFAFNPFFQWWFFTGTFLPAAWALFAGTTVLWVIKTSQWWIRLVLSFLLGYGLVGMAMGLYVPFIYAAALPGLALALGLLFDRSHAEGRSPLLVRLRATLPLFIGLFAGVAVLLIWLRSNWALVEGFTGTVYPGAREITTGGTGWPSWVSLSAAPFSLSLFGGETLSLLGPNSSEAATFFLPGLFLIIPLVWLSVARYRRVKRVDWVVTSQLIVLLVVIAFLVIPGWDAVAKLVCLQFLSPGRDRMFFGVLSFILLALFVARRDEFELFVDRQQIQRVPVWVKLSAPVLAGGVVAALALYFILSGAGVTVGGFGARTAALLTGVVVALFIASLALFSWRKTGWAAVALLLAVVPTTISVNPAYIGLYSLNSTGISKFVQERNVAAGSDANWVAVGGFIPATVLMHSGVTAMNGVQTVPQFPLWNLIDPERQYEQAWNRLGNISWAPGSGEPVPSNPAADQIQLNFDACSSFAQQHVNFVLSDEPLPQTCLAKLTQIVEGSATFFVYEVTQQ